MNDFALVLVQLAQPGAHVKKGDVVAEFDRQYQLNRIEDYRDTVIQLEANVKKMKADMADAAKGVTASPLTPEEKQARLREIFGLQ